MPDEITVTVNGYESDAIERRAAEIIADRVQQRIDEMLEEKIAAAVGEAAKRLTDAAVAEHVRSVLTEGWTETNTWGEPTGKKETVRGRIAKHFSEDVGDYNRRKKRIDQIATEVMENLMRGDFEKEIEAAKASVRAALKQKVDNGFADAVRTALGLRS